MLSDPLRELLVTSANQENNRISQTQNPTQSGSSSPFPNQADHSSKKGGASYMPVTAEAMNRETTKISLIIPVYNEADQLEQFLTLIDGINLGIKKELVIVNDCSKDQSAEIIRNFKFSSEMKFVDKPINEGKDAALRSGIAVASGELIGIQDADFEYNQEDIPALLEPLLRAQADVVYGSRYKNSALVHRTFHYLINRTLTMLSNLCSGLYLSDMETCYKFFRAEVIKGTILESNQFGFEPEITAKLAKLKLRVAEVPVQYFPRNYIEGKKIGWQDGIAAVRHILVYAFFRPMDRSFNEQLPQKFIPRGRNWL